MQKNNSDLLAEVANYYSEKIKLHGANFRGVDWNGAVSQELRFEQLCKIIDRKTSFSINDLGCGYGALHNFLANQYPEFSYCGIDVSKEMIMAARRLHFNQRCTKFVYASKPNEVADYGVASGIFNVRQGRSNREWLSYLEATLDILDSTSRYGFSFNCLTAYSDSEKMSDNLYYADPCEIFNLCKRQYSHNVALMHDYGLYEFTVLVRKSI